MPQSSVWGSPRNVTPRFQFLVRPADVSGPERQIAERANTSLVLVRREQHDGSLRARYAQLDPALLIVERLIGQDAEAQLLRVELERPILVGHWNAGELDALDHLSSLVKVLRGSKHCNLCV